MRCALGLIVVLLVGCASSNRGSDPPPPLPPSPSVQYLSLLQDRVQYSRERMGQMTASAEWAAKRVIAGRHMYAAGSQADFPKELIARSAGLACIAAPPKLLDRGDIVLYAAPSRLKVNDQIKITRWKNQGAYVVAFASADLSDNPYFPPNALIDSGPSEGLALADGKICPVDTVMNVINAWAWMGEFAAACTRQGKMPVFLQPPGGSDAYLRSTRYRGKTFHSDLTIEPVPPGALGTTYLDQIDCVIKAVMDESTRNTLPEAGRWLHDAGPSLSALIVEAHMFPEHYQDTRAPRPFEAVGFAVRTPPPSYPPLVVLLGYQKPPQLIIDANYVYRHKLIYTSVDRARDDNGVNLLYINPHITLEDGCVMPPGYDIPILPTSGVVQSAIYWSIVAEAIGVGNGSPGLANKSHDR